MIDVKDLGPFYNGMMMLPTLWLVTMPSMTPSTFTLSTVMAMVMHVMIFPLDHFSQGVLDQLCHMFDSIEMTNDLLSDWVDRF